MDFEWDPKKAIANFARHGVSFEEAATVFDDPLGAPFYDPDHSDDEDRFILFGTSSHGTLMMAAHTERGERVRIISARRLTREERMRYEEDSD